MVSFNAYNRKNAQFNQLTFKNFRNCFLGISGMDLPVGLLCHTPYDTRGGGRIEKQVLVVVTTLYQRPYNNCYKVFDSALWWTFSPTVTWNNNW